MTDAKKFSIKYYFHVLSRMIGDPKTFFSELSPDTGMKSPLIFLTISALIFTLSSLMNDPPNPALAAGILLLNAMGMVFVASGLGYMVIMITLGKRIAFHRVFAIYAFSSGVTLLASWMPYFLIITEPWKWWLICTGMTRHLSMSWKQTLSVVLLSVGIIVLFFWSLIPLLKSA